LQPKSAERKFFPAPQAWGIMSQASATVIYAFAVT
jgi:hypothetical protein